MVFGFQSYLLLFWRWPWIGINPQHQGILKAGDLEILFATGKVQMNFPEAAVSLPTCWIDGGGNLPKFYGVGSNVNMLHVR